MIRIVSLLFFLCFFSFDAQVLLAVPTTPTDATSLHERLFAHGMRIFIKKRPFYFVLVEKDRQRLTVFAHDEVPRVVTEFACATGENPGRKKESGDSRTPEGIYFITKIYTDNKITIFGNRAMHLDYPNTFDVAAGRNGNGIYIHGTNKELKPNTTNGCITLRNSDLEQLTEYVEKEVTPVIIVPSSDVFKNENAGRFPLQPVLAEDLLLPEVVNRADVEFDYLYSIHDGLQTVVLGEFVEHQKSPKRYASLRWRMRSYLEPDNKSGGWISRKKVWQTTPLERAPSLPEPAETAVAAVQPGIKEQVKEQVEPEEPVVAAAPPEAIKLPEEQVTIAEPERPETEKVPKPQADHRDEQQVAQFVEAWRQAWQSKEIDAYIDCYIASFRKDKMDLTAWRSYKERLNRKYKTIHVNVSGLRIDWTEAGAVVTFHQVYRSDKYFAKGIKTLHLAYKEPGWKITRELWHSD